MRTLTSVIGAAGSVFLLTRYAVNVIRDEYRRAKIDPCEPWPAWTEPQITKRKNNYQ